MKYILLSTALIAAPVAAQDHARHQPATSPEAAEPDHSQMDHSAHEAPAAAQAPEAAEPDHSQMDHSAHQAPAAGGAHHSGAAAGEAPRQHGMTGAYGPYPMNREASGTAWQPDTSEHGGFHLATGGWTVMAHAVLNGVYSLQGGPRGAEEAFLSGMVMASARRDVGSGGTFQLRGMLSPDPLMGRSGYPLLLASGETANGTEPLVDRQHPHDFFMELSASYSQRIGPRTSLFVYGGLPGEPAFGPPAFMHRLSIMDSPEAPISHHWLDSTHIVFGVLTAGVTHGPFKAEASRFRGREPDQHRWDIETGPLDSTAIRVSLNPIPELSLQASWADVKSPEQLEPEADQTRWSASAIYTRPLGEGWWSTMIAWGRRSADHDQLDAWVLESAVRQGPWTLFGRAERTENNELVSEGGHHGPTFDVAKVSVGLVRDFRIAEHAAFGVGGLVSANFVPAGLEALYGGDPLGGMIFVRLKID